MLLPWRIESMNTIRVRGKKRFLTVFWKGPIKARVLLLNSYLPYDFCSSGKDQCFIIKASYTLRRKDPFFLPWILSNYRTLIGNRFFNFVVWILSGHSPPRSSNYFSCTSARSVILKTVFSSVSTFCSMNETSSAKFIRWRFIWLSWIALDIWIRLDR